MSRVSVEIKDYIAHVTLTRADKHNGVDDDMLNAVVEAGEGLMESDARAVVLSGEGKSFCAGLDVMSFAKLAASDPDKLLMPRSHDNANLFQAFAMVWRRLPMPVIVAIHGACYGAGFQLALGADIRIAAADAKLSVMEMKWGLIPDMGGMVLLPSLVRSDVMRKLTYTAGPVSGEEAAGLGLVTELADDPLLRAQELAGEIAGKSPTAIRAAKRLMTLAESGAGEDEVLLAESREQAGLIGKPHQMEVISANMAKRAPVFK
ncbi:MAG: crotonase/enoyl-CoA hydratase family protein [Pseudomonadota bacterium]